MSSDDGGLRDLFRKHLGSSNFYVETVEMGLINRGFPDVNFAATGGIEGWVEMKQTPHWRPKIRPAQIAWLTLRSSLGCRTFIAVRRALNELWLMGGDQVRLIHYEGLRAPDLKVLGQWSGGPSKWDWGRVKDILTR